MAESIEWEILIGYQSASSQERPYVSRPSRSQQLRNPKLVPKLTNDTPNPVEKKKGLADEILAKQEAQRTRLQELEGGDESDVAPSPNRRRSVSSESVSTVSTALSRRSRSPRSPRSSRPLAAPKSQPRRRSPSYDHVQRDVSPRRSISRSLSPPMRRRRSLSRDSLSPRRSLSPEPGRRRRSPFYDDVGRNVSPRRSISRSLSPAVRRSRMRSRDSLSPRGDFRERHYRNRAEDRRGSGSVGQRRGNAALPTAHSLRGHRAEDIEDIEVVAEVEEVEEVAHRTTVAVEEIRTLKHHDSEV
ncbi:hypothetical protein E4U30_001226 [Claviceps sp. LM220 group G6]|nr:hypothetical protein E4U30_001226 [Claviceps sp. LM220 group G6]KAG6121089.1 hypothetical protein E4U14_002530 [Claviceps sp. LM454 group G7]